MEKYVCGKCRATFYPEGTQLMKDPDFQTFGSCRDCGKITDIFKVRY